MILLLICKRPHFIQNLYDDYVIFQWLEKYWSDFPILGTFLTAVDRMRRQLEEASGLPYELFNGSGDCCCDKGGTCA